MPRLIPCLGRLEDGTLCGKLTDGRYSRCPTCAPIYERRRNEAEPWRLFYDDPRWFTTRMKVRERDGQQCTHVSGNRRCLSEGPLSVHHEKKLRHLWAECGKPQPRTAGWQRFVTLALDMRKLRTLCEPHHKLADDNHPDEQRQPPGRAGSQHRRRRRHMKKRTRRKIQEAEPRRDEPHEDE